MDKEDQYLSIDIKTKFIGGLVAKILGGVFNKHPWLSFFQKKKKKSLVRRGLRYRESDKGRHFKAVKWTG